MNKLTLVISGERGSGRSSLTKFILCEYLNEKVGQDRFLLEKFNKDTALVDTFNNNRSVLPESPCKHTTDIFSTYSVKTYSFLDPAKKICMDVLGLDLMQCYGSDEDKASGTHISWEDIPTEIRERHSKPRRGIKGNKPARGFMTAKDVITVVENDVFRRIDPSSWARALYSQIDSDGYELAIVMDANFSSEITIGTEKGALAVRLTKKNNKDLHSQLVDFPRGEYNLVLDNQNWTMAQTHGKFKPYLHKYLSERNLI